MGYRERPLGEYLGDLAAKKAAPGGGSAAALSAAIGVGLMSMVANYTAGNPKFKDVESKVSEILKKAQAYRQRLEDLIDEDVEAYSNLSKVMKGSEKDAFKLEAAYKEAVKAPYETCKIVFDAIKLCGELVDIGNKNLITDTAIAAILLEGAFFSAKFNVYINLKYVKDMGWVGCVHEALVTHEKLIPKMKEEILEKCEEVIK